MRLTWEEHLARWFGTTPPHAGRMLAAIAGELADVDVDGTSARMPAADAAEARAGDPVDPVRLPPAFDQYVVTAPRGPSPLLAADAVDRVYRPQGWLSPVVLAGGRMAGVWGSGL